MTRPEHPRLPYVPKLRRARLKYSLTHAINYSKKHEQTAVEALEWMLGGVNGGHFDWKPEHGTLVERVDTNAVRQYLKKSIKYARSFPDRVDAVGQLQRFREVIDSGRFAPKRLEDVSEAITLQVAQVDPGALKVSQIGVQSLSATSVTYGELRARTITSGILTRGGFIDTDDVEPW